MAVTGVDSHLSAAFETSFPVPFFRNQFAAHATGTLVSIESSAWQGVGFPGAANTPATGSGETCDRDTLGAIPLPDPVVGKKIYLNSFQMLSGGQAAFKLYDRLVQNSGLSGAVGGPPGGANDQAINTVALPSRAASGFLVIPFVEVYLAAGATLTTITLNYTNHLNAARVGVTVNASLNGIGRLIPLNLQGNDRGVKSIQSINFNPVTGGAGNIGVVLARLINWRPSSGVSLADYPQNATETGGSIVDDNACLFVAGQYTAASTTLLNGLLSFIQA